MVTRLKPENPPAAVSRRKDFPYIGSRDRDADAPDRCPHGSPAVPVPPGRARGAGLAAPARVARRLARAVARRAVAARALRQVRRAAARRDGRPAHRVLLRRSGARPARAGDHVDAAAAADAQHDGPVHRRSHAGGRRGVHRGLLRRSRAPVHAPGLLRPAHRLAEPPVRDPRLAARARHVGRRGSHPPLPHQGAGRAAVRPAPSTAATAPGWTSSATPRRWCRS